MQYFSFVPFERSVSAQNYRRSTVKIFYSFFMKHPIKAELAPLHKTVNYLTTTSSLCTIASAVPREIGGKRVVAAYPR
jgi:hypothetical protein